jgi:hypothetical protein
MQLQTCQRQLLAFQRKPEETECAEIPAWYIFYSIGYWFNKLIGRHIKTTRITTIQWNPSRWPPQLRDHPATDTKFPQSRMISSLTL